MSAKLTLKKSISLCSMAFITAVMVLCFMGANAQSKVKETNKRGTKKVDAKSERMREREEEEREEKEKDGPAQILERDIMMMKDPALGYVPTERLLDAKKYKDHLMQQAFAPIGGVSWKEQGPINQGGRSRAIMVDPNDGTGNTVWAGSVGGGLWKTTNINSATPNWTPVNDLASNLAVTSIAYDPSNPLIMYFATGEGYNNSDAIRGLGVWKSTDGGAIWAQLASTNIGTFNFCQKVVVNSTGIVLVATASGGLQRSSNGGTTWTKVLGTGLGITGAASNFCYDVDIAANGDVYATLDGSVHKSTNAGVTFAAAQTLGISASRIELACAPSDANYVYALVENGNVVNGILQTTNGGTSWTLRTEPADADPGIPATDFSRGQAWYDLTIAVDPNNRDRLFAGGIDLFLSADGAGTWTQVSHWYGGFGFQYTHADQHNIVFQNGSSSVAYFVNDGGVFRSTNANVATPTIDNRGTNYRTTQFYSCAMHPTAQTPYYLAGAQDNGTHQFKLSGLQATTEVTGGDGAWCHIDQDQPQFQFTQYVFNDYYRSSDGGSTWTNVTFGGTGQFINPTDYDDLNNKMYAANNSNQYLRWDDPQTGATFVTIAAAALNGQVSAVKVSPNTANRVFFGSVSGRVIMVDNANTATPTITNISTGLPGGAYVSCVEVETGNDNHLLATFSNYGVNSVWESTNGGTSWTSVEGNLPDMPIRWALFNPNNNDQTIIATELGVWSTDNLNAGATVWGASNSGLANVRVDMLQLRQSDKFVIAATHGRGLYTSDLFTTPTAIFSSDIQLAYINSSIQFTNESYQSTSWSWNFGDGSPLSTAENPSHTYTTAGKFNVTLTINAGASTLTKTQYIQILPNRGTPYVVATDGSTFEINPDDFGSQAIRGGINKWELGVPTNFLTTVNSPVNVWKTDLDADLTSGDYACVLQTPSYNFTSSASAYTLRFRRSMEIAFCNGPFAVQLQYSTDKGLTWTRLGVNADPAATNWYNRGPATGCPVDVAVFADQYGWTLTANNTLCTYNITTGAPALVGQSDVTFRFVLSVEPGFPAGGYAVDGFMIDDFEILGPVNSAIGGASITTTGVLIPFVSCQGSVSAEQSFTVSGTGLTANLLVTPPTGFEVSLTSGSGFASSLSFTPSSGSVPTTTIFVRLTAAASGTPSGNIACTSTGATTQDVAVSGTVYNPTLTVNAQTNVSCFGGTNGAASVNAAAGGLAPYSYNWTPGNPAGDGTVSVTGLTAGSWTCTVTDNNGCTSSISFIITDPTVIVANCSGTNVSCNGGNNGSASVSASGGTGTLTYLWNNSNTNSSISGLTAGTYTVTVTDANGCTQTCAYTVTQPTTIVANCSGTNVSCDGGSNGSASVAASGGTGTLTYFWSNTNTNSSISGLSSGTYSVTVTDANGCTQTCAYTVTQPTTIVANCSGTNVSCNGGSNGSASVAASGGTGTLSYLWSNLNTNSSISGLTAGTYTVTVTDANGCTLSCSYIVTQGPAISLSNVPTNVSSCFTNNGAINLTVSGGVPCGANSKGLLISKIFANPNGTDSPFEFVQLVATKNIDFSVNPYTVIVSNNGIATVNGWKAGAAITYAFEINTGTANGGDIYYVGGSSMVPVANRLRSINTSTTGGDGGVGNLSASGVFGNGGTSDGVAVFAGTIASINSTTVPVDATFFGATRTNAIVGGGAGGYELPVNDFYPTGGKFNATSFTFGTDPGNDIIFNINGTYNATTNVFTTARAFTSNNISTFNAATTGLTLTNFAAYTYLWSNGATTEDVTGLSPGTYTVTVTDCNGCTATMSQTIVAPAAPAVTCSSSNNTSCTGANGTASATTSAASPTYVWSNSATAASITGLAAATYTVIVTDGVTGCTASCTSVVANSILNPTATCSSTDNSNCTPANGSVSVTTSASSPTYSWSNSATAASVSALGAATYTVMVTETTTGCTVTCSATVINTSVSITASCTAVDNTSCSTPNGSASVTTSATSPTYAWSGGGTSATITGLAGGTYTVLVTDGVTGCTATCAAFVGSSTINPTATCSSTDNTNCTSANGSASVTTNATSPSYSWSNGNSNSSISGLAAGTYTVIVTETGTGCTATCEAVVANATVNPTLTCSSTNNTSCLSPNGSASVSDNATSPTYSWSNNASTNSISGLGAGTYTVTVTDGVTGCSASCTSVVNNVQSTPTATCSGSAITCNGTNNGTANILANGGTPTYTYSWSNSNTNSSISGLAAGTYTVTVTDANGCTAQCSYTVTTPAAVGAVCSSTNITCFGLNDGTNSVSALGGTPPYTYAWNGGSTNASNTGLSAGTYTVTVTDANSCFATCSVTISEPPLVSITVSNNSPFCAGGDLAFSVTPSVGGLLYSWSGPNAFSSSLQNPVLLGAMSNASGTYTVTATDLSGCSASATSMVSVYFSPALPIVTTPVNYCLNSVSTPLTAIGDSLKWYTDSTISTPLSTAPTTLTTVAGQTCYFVSASKYTPNPVSSISAGDIAIIGRQNGATDAVQFVTLVDMPAGTVIYFTDNGWTGTGFRGSSATDGNGFEGLIKFTSNAIIPAGNVITSISTSPSYTWVTSGGTIPGTSTPWGGVDLAAAGDQIYAFRSDSVNNPLFHASVITHLFVWDDTNLFENATTSNTGNIPPGLTLGTTAITFSNATTGTSKMNNDGTARSAAQWLAYNALVSNWTLTTAVFPTTTLSMTPGGTGIGNTCETARVKICVNVNAPITVTASSNAPICAGGNLNLFATNGANSYTWSGPNTFGSTLQNPTITGVTTAATGTYTVTVVDVNGCTSTSQVGVVINATPDLQPLAPLANNCPTTTVDLTAITLVDNNGTTGTLSYFKDANLTISETNPSAVAVSGMYYIVKTTTSSPACTDVDSVQVTISPCLCTPPSMVPNTTHVSCFGGNNGAIDIATSGGTAPYTYLWSNGNTNEDLTGLTAGTYTVTVTDAQPCSTQLVVTVNQPSAIVLSSTHTNASCFGLSDGSIDLTVSGGTSGYTYSWSSGASTEDVTGLAAGTYTVVVTDFNLCTTTQSIVITSPPAIAGNVAVTNNQCYGNTSGVVNLTIYSDTIGEFARPGLLISEVMANPVGTDSSYEFVELIATKTINFATTPYSVIFTNNGTATANGWKQGLSISYGFDISTGIVNKGDIVYVGGNQMVPTGTKIRSKSIGTAGDGGLGTATPANGVLGNGGANADGVAVFKGNIASVTSSTVPLDAIFYGAGPTPGSAVVSAGAAGYQLPVNDKYPGGKLQSTSFVGYDATLAGNTLRATGTFNIATNSFSINRNWDSLFYVNNNLSQVSLIGSSTFLWSNGATTEDIINLAAGSYTVTVTAANGCTTTFTGVVTTPDSISLIKTVDSINCFGGSDGSIQIAASGGTPSYSYSWSSGQSTSSISGLVAGTYTVTVTDANGCTKTCVVELADPAELQAGAIPTDETCEYLNNGMVEVQAIGGTGLFTVNIVGGVVNETVTGISFNYIFDSLAAGNYIITVTDANGCSTQFSTDVFEPAPLAVTQTITQVACNGAATGAIDITVAGGTPSYTFAWSNSTTTEDQTNLSAGNYSVVVTDAAGCTTSASFVITEPTLLVATATSTNVTCNGANNGTLNASASGGVPTYTYSWSNSITGSSQTGLGSGTYTVTVTDGNGCSKTSSTTIAEPAALAIILTPTNTTCALSNGSISASVSGGTLNYNYSWSNGASTQNLSSIAAGTYTVNVTDANGCTKSGSITITNTGTIPAQPGAISGSSTICKNTSQSFSIIAVPGATNYTWSAGPGATITLGQGTTNVTIAFSNLATASSVSVFASNGCGNSLPRTKAYTILNGTPATPTSILGPLWGNCKKVNVGYSCTASAGATTYTWTVPAGVTINSGQGTNAIIVTYGLAFTGSGNISVTASNSCGTSTARTVVTNAKPQLLVISGLNYACQYQSGLVYTVAAVPGAAGYTWTVVAGSTILSGQGTTSITVKWGVINGVIKCVANNACGSSIQAQFPVSFVCKEDGTPFDLSELNLFPNPANETTTLQFEGFNEGNATITIYDVIGKQTLNTEIPVVVGDNKFPINVSTLAKGVYNIKVIFNGYTRIQRMVVQ